MRPLKAQMHDSMIFHMIQVTVSVKFDSKFPLEQYLQY